MLKVEGLETAYGVSQVLFGVSFDIAQGEVVTVRNPESRKDFAALVVAENRVQVRF